MKHYHLLVLNRRALCDNSNKLSIGIDQLSVDGCLATDGHADGFGTAGDYCYGTDGLQALAV